MTTSIALLAALVLAASLGCTASPTSPTPGFPSGPRTGTWVGPLNDAANGGGTLRLTVTEVATGSGQGFFSGTWTAAFADPSQDAGGDLTGTVSGATGQLSLVRSTPLTCGGGGPFALLLGSFFAPSLSISTTAITGAYQFQACTGVAGGTLDVRKQ